MDSLSLEQLRQRQSIKWQLYPPDVLPMWVAELDVPLAPCVAEVLQQAVDRGDTGYAAPFRLGAAFAGFARRHWDWDVDPSWCFPVADVMAGVVEVLKVTTDPGDRVVICPPVYHPFFEVPPSVGRPVELVPLVDGALDLPGIDVALGGGARAVLLSSPHNPTGRVWSADELAQLDQVVRRHDAVVLADEVHAPLTLPGATFTPYALTPRRAVVLTSGSKAFNLAGLKAALLVAGDADVLTKLRQIPAEVAYKVGHLGWLANTAALTDGDAWLAELISHLDRMRSLVVNGLPPAIGVTVPEASYLAWLSFPDELPAARLLRDQRLALSEGADFGLTHHARLNFGTTTEVLTLALEKLKGPPLG
ncbi:MAG: MalY/PatB family protein [Mycobacteriales bacterium]